MHKLLLPLCLAIALNASAQKDTLSPEQTRELLKQMQMDTVSFVSSSGKSACDCIAKADRKEKKKEDKTKAFADCIDKEVSSYLLTSRVLKQMMGTDTSKVITMAGQNSDEYKAGYFEIERWLMDNCETLKTAIASNDDAHKKAYSKNKNAMKAYDKGVVEMQAGNLTEAIGWFEDAVRMDPEFVFAWDNLGVSYRKNNNLEKAEEAYKKSLKVYPKGYTSLMNLPVVYLKQGRVDDAINGYKDLLEKYPKDPEGFYGIGMVYIQLKKDYETALGYFCKAYNIYVEQKSAYRTDAESLISQIYQKMKADGKEKRFGEILAEHSIRWQ
jgi:tetratricopeptide (TPR) repeat protein